ncbi:gamma-glutamyl-gamma-aminobutyrate hydrolase family protein [Pseudoflavonifractor sp. 60]|uniref:gamma-glutamyl-gamma-aminobutyrate hydrolase family protein n=1 Tax=Pseudoflavonifractor sp. 60 TaxID=2304576 RepID=UPI00136DEE8E|nr:gamma-glutamyl-gamma-aminobutyrate hydrolase family protein [Pseudoflavonifractor sp. 60]NBI68277.1 gamma-glutamyl-gamma-aminobutyrate hydrolase family protein [Pseudoflavonifractor sp. 60]
MGRPIIGILSSRSDIPLPGGPNLSIEYASVAYCRAVVRGGGTPLLLPVTPEPELAEQMFAQCDGILFPGGVDVDPRFYGEAPDPMLGTVDSTMDRFWLQALDFALDHKLPLLGICRGMQLVNVGLGGSLYQDLVRRGVPSYLHSQKQSRDYLMHQVKLTPGSRLSAVLGEESVYTNTMHHQCVKEPGKGLKRVAQTDDGVPEALESEDGQIMLVQWHPEALLETEPRMCRLFEDLIERCRGEQQ